jgi:hypothetical protein
MTDLREIFGEVISVYTRAQAIEDGVLIDVSSHEDAKRTFKIPVALTCDLYAEMRRGQGKDDRTFAGRLWDVLYMSRFGRADGPSDRYYKVIVGRRTLRLRLNIGPGDNAEPVVTVGFPRDF